MKIIHFYFFCLYNAFYKNGDWVLDRNKWSVKAQYEPETRTLVLLSLSSWCWIFLLGLFLKIKIAQIGAKAFLPIELFIFIIFYAIYFFYFVNNDKYLTIYQDFKETDKIIQKKGITRCGIFLATPFVILLLKFIYWCMVSSNLISR